MFVAQGEFITIQDACAQYSLSRSGIYRLRKEGRLLFHKLKEKGRSYLRRPEVEQLFNPEMR